jgi:hypothetical protein
MKTFLQKLAITAIILAPSLAQATDRRPDVQFNVVNNTNHPVTFHSNTTCADFPGTFVVPAHSARGIWGEPMDHGGCTWESKAIWLTADGYDLQFETTSMFDITPTLNKRWNYKMVRSTDGIGLGSAQYDGNDLILLFTVSE